MRILDEGMNLELGSIDLMAVPAHFLHAEGNFQFYDPHSRMRSRATSVPTCVRPRSSIRRPSNSTVMPFMEAFHKRR